MGPNYQDSNIGSDYGLAPARRQAIVWTNGGEFTDAYMRHSASIELNDERRQQIRISANYWESFIVGDWTLTTLIAFDIWMYLNLKSIKAIKLQCSLGLSWVDSYCKVDITLQHYSENVVILTNFSSLSAPEVVKWQLLVQPVLKVLSKWQQLCFSERLTEITSVYPVFIFLPHPHEVVGNILLWLCPMLTLLSLKPKYARMTRPVPWLLMPWFLMSHVFRQPSYQVHTHSQCWKIKKKMQWYFMLPDLNSVRKWLTMQDMTFSSYYVSIA